MKQLPAATVRLLSSSQVITSVVSVVKELMENSLDADASNVVVKLENFGLDRIEVRDDGCGIKAADAPVMAVRHFTSKICSHEDLERLQTYGFRGEALGSICAVAEVSVSTKTEEDNVCTRYTLDPTGSITSQRPSPLGRGTMVTVAKLFRNLPVRRQHYSSSRRCREEVRKVQELLMAYAVIRPELSLTLLHNKTLVWQKHKAADIRGALVATLGPGAVANLLPCHQEQPEMVLDGFLPRPGADLSVTSSASSDKTFIFINNRPVQHKDIMKLLRQHYSAQYPEDAARQRYPVLLLSVTVSPAAVDVNLTPDKTQVLLENKEAVLTAVEALLVSLYGFRPDSDQPAGEHPNHQKPPPPSNHTETDAQPLEIKGGENPSTSSHDGGDGAGSHDDGGGAPLQRQASSCSSSSSVADDWVVNQVPAQLRSGSPLCDDEAPQSRPQMAETGPTSNAPKKPDGCGVPAAEEGGGVQISAQDWSRGTALTDPASGEPLRPILIHRPDPEEARGRTNAITEKRAALTAYHLISSRALKAPPSPAALFEKEARVEVLRERPAASVQEVGAAVQERWNNLTEDDRKRFEEKAKRSQDLHEQRAKQASDGTEPAPRVRTPAQKRKAPLSNQQLLDQLFSAQPQKKTRAPPPKPSRPLPCSVAALRERLLRLSSQGAAEPRGVRLVSRLGSQSAWVVSSGRRLLLMNPFRVEEALLFRRLQEDHVLPAAALQNPLQLTERNLGGAEFVEALCRLEKQPAELDGSVFFSDARLVANGFRVRLLPAAERHLEVAAMADCVPFLGVDDLREVLAAVVHRKAATAQQCRPLKVTNYLKAEAVRLARQLPPGLPRRDVEELNGRMERQLGGANHTCVHGRPLLHHLTHIPSTDAEAKAQVGPLEL